MKTLVIFYSLSGETRREAESIARKTGSDLMEIRQKHPLKNGVSATLYHWFGGVFPRRLEPSSIDLIDYDRIHIGAPVWWMGPARPIMDFLKTTDFAGKEVVPFISHGGGPASTLEIMKRRVRNGLVAG